MTHVRRRPWQQAADVDGWMTADQGRRLFAAAARCRPGGRIVEIGSFRGRSHDRAGRRGARRRRGRGHRPARRQRPRPAGDRRVRRRGRRRPRRVPAPTSPRPASPIGCATSPRSPTDAHGEVDGPDRRAVHRRRPPLRPGAQRHPRVGRSGHGRRDAADPRLVLVDRRDRWRSAASSWSAAGSATSGDPARSPSTAPTCAAVGSGGSRNAAVQLAQLRLVRPQRRPQGDPQARLRPARRPPRAPGPGMAVLARVSGAVATGSVDPLRLGPHHSIGGDGRRAIGARRRAARRGGQGRRPAWRHRPRPRPLVRRLGAERRRAP